MNLHQATIHGLYALELKQYILQVRLLFSIFSFFCWISNYSLYAQSLRDTIILNSVQIDGRKKVANSNEARSEVDSIALAKSSTVRLSELLSQNTPIFIKEYGRGAMATASFRGTAPSHTKLSWNGLEINSPMLGMVDFSLVPVFFTDEIKLLHGASSLSESAGAFGGTILLSNKADWSNKFSGKLISGVGSYKTFDEYLQIALGDRKVQSKSSFFYNASDNDFSFINKLNAEIDPITGNYIFRKEKNQNADYLNYGLLQENYFQSGTNNTLSFKNWLQHNERSIPQLQTNESADGSNLNRQIENTIRSVAEWKHYGSVSRFSVLFALNTQNSEYRLNNTIGGSQSILVIDARSKVLSLVNKLNYRLQISRKVTLISGLESSFHTVDSKNILLSNNGAGYEKKRVENSIFGGFEAKLSPKLNTYLLLRDLIIDFQHQAFLPFLRSNFKPFNNNSFLLSGSFGLNCHYPTLNDLYYLPGGNPNLKSEHGYQAEISSDYYFTKANKSLKAGLSFFHSAVRDWIIWLPTFQGYWEPSNIEKVIGTGIETKLEWSQQIRAIRLRIIGNFEISRTNNKSSSNKNLDKQLPYIPKSAGNLFLHLNYSIFEVDWNWNYYSKRFTTTANSEETISDYLYPYFMNNVQFGISVPKGKNKLSCMLKVLNVFDEDYRTVLQRPMPGRNYQIVFQYGF